MPIGNFEYYFIPVLSALKKNGKMHRRENMNAVAIMEKVTDSELQLQTDHGTNIFRSRVGWAQAFLVQAGAVMRPERGYLQITDRGLKLLEDNPEGFKVSKFREFPDYALAWGRSRNKPNSDTPHEIDNYAVSPHEKIESAIDDLERGLAQELVMRIQVQPPKFLEIVVLKLLHSMGYGASNASIEHLGGPGDEGVDGVINQDTLGLQRIYVQAKRYKNENTIGRPEIQKFLGAIAGLGANGGVYITTSSFTNDAKDFAAKNLTPRIVLVDGNDLGMLMVRNGIGVQLKKTYQISDIDEDFFEI